MLTARLREHFRVPGIRAHPWFEKWSEVLAPLGYSYSRNVAQLDMSPRATISVAAAPQKAIFLRMMEADVDWMFRLLQHCRRARVVFLSGAVSKREYMFEFLRRLAPSSGYEPEHVAFATADTRRQAPRFLPLQGTVTLPVFSLSNSPSSRTPGAMNDAFKSADKSLRSGGFAAVASPH